jgi:lipopolysaccharide export system permease protein
MSGIFFRHVLRHVALATFAVAAVLIVLMLTNQLAFMLGRAAEGQIPSAVVWEMVSLSIRQNSMIILPIAVVLGTILGLGRLYHDSELAAAQACGVGPGTLYAAAGVVTLAASAIAAWISFVDGPSAAIRSTQIRVEALRTAASRGLTAGQFRSLGSGTTLYFRERDSDGALSDVFVQRRLAKQLLHHHFAEWGELRRCSRAGSLAKHAVSRTNRSFPNARSHLARAATR